MTDRGLPVRHNAGPTIRGVTPRGTVKRNTSRSRWKCPACGSLNVQIRLPVWFREYADGCLVETSVDEEADPQAFYCEDCHACESDAPTPSEDMPSACPGGVFTRDFHGYYQYRTSSAGPWLFYVCGFSGAAHADGTDSECRVLRTDGRSEAAIRIDSQGRIRIRGRLYSRRRWTH